MANLSASRMPVQVPALILAAAVLLWGWHQSLLIYAVIAAVLVEGVRVVKFRWQFDDSDFNRLGDVTGVGLVLLLVVQFTDHGLTGIYGVLRWFPMVVLGLTLAQLYSTRDSTPLSAMFPSVRFALKRGRITEPGNLDMRLPFLIACMLSACAAPQRSAWILPVEAAMLVWLLWANRPPQRSVRAVTVALLVCVLVAGVAAGAVGATRKALGPVIMDIMRERMAHWRDPFRNHTALGEIGRLKLSDRIVMRIESPPGIPVPRLLHEATYTHLSNNVWLAGASRFAELTPGADGTRWDLSEDRRPFSTVTIAKSLIRNKAMLAVPAGAFRIEELPVEELHANSLGALKVQNGPALVRYRVRYATGAGLRAGPVENDRVVPQRLIDVLSTTLEKLDLPVSMPEQVPDQEHAKALEHVSEQIGAGTKPIGSGAPTRDPAQIIRGLQEYFSSSFRYSLQLTAPTEETHPIEDFLLRGHSGHCEFFATATVLLLRAAGIPARYATGFSVQEYSELEQAWVVRRRHAHAWAVAWVDDRWVAVDTTPVQWFVEEAQGSAWWQPLYDAISWVWHRFSRWRLDSSGEEVESKKLLWVLLPLLLFLAWRVVRSRRVTNAGKSRIGEPGLARRMRRGTDSEFYQIEQMLAAQGLQRPRHCSPRAWLAQLAVQGALPQGNSELEEILKLHYRLRFAEDGLDSGQRRQLAQRVARWLRIATRSATDSTETAL